VNLTKIGEARHFLSQFFPPTRLVFAPTLSRRSNCEVYLKLESDLPTGSFKPRGALFALHCALRENSIREVVTSSTGNHGAAVAYAAGSVGVLATIFLPANPNPIKRGKIADLGANIIEVGKSLTESVAAAHEYAREKNAYLLDDATNPDIPIGTATIASEILEQLPGVNAIYVPVGDTALIRGIAAFTKTTRSDISITGVQAQGAPSYYNCWRTGSMEAPYSCDTIADGLATSRVIRDNVAAIRELVDQMELVTDEEMLEAIRHLFQEEGVKSEPAGAAATAALRKKPLNSPSQTIVLIVSGSNVPPNIFSAAMRSQRSGGNACPAG
jgi:threonine dehydratase